jgi:hypothetical protein
MIAGCSVTVLVNIRLLQWISPGGRQPVPGEITLGAVPLGIAAALVLVVVAGISGLGNATEQCIGSRQHS